MKPPPRDLTDSDADEEIEIASYVASQMARDLIGRDTPSTAAPPRYLCWRPHPEGLMVETLRACWLIRPEVDDGAWERLKGMIHAGFEGGTRGNC